MSDQVLYRKYRSARFDEVVGQDHVVTTLVNALSSGRTSHAYLFTGPRGTGKTSVARLLAKALNCTGNPKPCNQCASCKAIQNASLDVIEIDAASNRSIDSIRELKDKINLAPSQGRYKVYIIDEVHMLTAEAFNALLKTLEEPPAHAVFILATTEAHKLPATIISRTQRFNFRPISSTDLIRHLAKIAAAEKIDIEPAALEVIAQSARGGFRDAISLLDQLSATGATPITATTARELLGFTDIEAIIAISTAIAESDAKTALIAIGKLTSSGTPATQLVVQLTDFWRDQLLAAAGASDTQLQSLGVLPVRCAEIVQALLEVSRTSWPELSLEAAVVQLTAKTTKSVAQQPEELPKLSHQTTTPQSSNEQPVAAPIPQEPTAPGPQAKEPVSALTAELWPKVLVLIKSQSVPLSASLQMYPADFGDNEVIIKPRFNFHRDLFLKPANLRLIEAAAAKVYGRPVRITAYTDERLRPKGKAVDPNTELVSSALEILGGEVVD